MRKFRRWFIIILFMLLGMEILTIAPKKLGTKEERKGKKEERSQVSTTSQVMRGVKYVEVTTLGKEWELEAEYAQGYKEKGTWQMQGATTRYFGNSKISYTVKGKRGTIEFETKNMIIEGDVSIVTSDGFIMKTDSIKFISKTHELSTDDKITVLGPKKNGKFELTSVGFIADVKSNSMLLKSDVTAVREIGHDKEMNIKSEQAVINTNSNVAQFQKNVLVDLEGVRMTGRSADFVYNQQSRRLNNMVLQGDVRITNRQQYASSEKVEVIFDKNEFVLSGNPRVMQNDNELRGEEIRLINGGKEVRVLKAKAKVEDTAPKGSL